jgi:acyl-CoA synthetase (AMP-forming)/AMP-acid ligase II
VETRTLPELDTLTAVLERHARERPDATAYSFMPEGEEVGDTIAYAELNRRSRALAATLQERGLAGERALLAHPSGIDFVVALLACHLAGLVAVPANLAGAAHSIVARLEAIAADAELAVVLAPGEVVDARDALLPEGSPLRPLDWLPTDRAPDGAAEGFVPEPVGAGDLALFQYTSGSTGTPRGVMLTHSNLYRQARVINEVFGGRPGDAVVSWLPLFHDMGLVSSVLCPLYGGYHSAFMPPLAFLQRPLRWLEAVDRFGGKIAGGPNFAYDLCVRKTTEEERARLDLSSWRMAFNGAEPVHAETLERFAEAFRGRGFDPSAFSPCYGLAEATCGISCTREGEPPLVLSVDAAELGRGRITPASGAAARRLVSAGPVVRDHAVRVVGPETRRERGAGEVGEIWVEGPCVGVGYWNRAEETEATFAARVEDGGGGPFLRTGDLGFVAEGHLFITGRLKDIVIVHGMNHYPHDIERSAERAHPGLRPGCGAAFAVPGADGARLVGVLAGRDPGAGAEELAAIDTAVRAAVSRDHGLPVEDVVLVAPRTIPKTSSGKVQRRRCREDYERGALEALGASSA